MQEPIDEDALDWAAREGYAVRCQTNGPRVLAAYASPEIMQKQKQDARAIVSGYLKAMSDLKKHGYVRNE